jgi:hypothetical protein
MGDYSYYTFENGR